MIESTAVVINQLEATSNDLKLLATAVYEDVEARRNVDPKLSQRRAIHNLHVDIFKETDDFVKASRLTDYFKTVVWLVRQTGQIGRAHV